MGSSARKEAARLAEDFAAMFDLRVGDERFRAEVADGRLAVVRGDAPAPDAIVETDHGTLLALAHRRIDLADAVRSGEVAIVGDAKAVEHFLGLFTLPEPFASAA
ncbi:MAG: alkyl sulfatase C-terminal domain-containing protein [Thermoleophilaceae bacterium]